MKPESPLRVAIAKGTQAAWQNRWPGLCLWVFGILIVVGYFNVEGIRAFFASVGNFKTRTGIIFGVVSTAIFGGLLPTVLPIVFGKPRPRLFWSLVFSNVVFWGLKGIEVDLLYKFQAWMFGEDSDFKTIACKVVVDLLIYAPAIGLFNCVLFYVWRDNGYSFKRTRESLGERWYVRKVLPALISNWFVWIPSVIIIYCLPLPLQLPVQNIILCFWVLILVFFTKADVDDEIDKATDINQNRI